MPCYAVLVVVAVAVERKGGWGGEGEEIIEFSRGHRPRFFRTRVGGANEKGVVRDLVGRKGRDGGLRSEGKGKKGVHVVGGHEVVRGRCGMLDYHGDDGEWQCGTHE